MSCISCRSANQEDFLAEANVHFPGLKGLDRPTVWAFPRLRICLDCGFTEFRLEDSERQELSKPSRHAQHREA
jgi:hypothetical protein